MDAQMQFLYNAYDLFIRNFPVQYQGLVSLGLLAIIVIGLFQAVKKSLIWLLLLVLFIPASIPIISKIGQGILLFLQYIFHHA